MSTRRLFFALWPDRTMQEGLSEAVRSAMSAVHGRPVPLESLHITLAFLGAVPEASLPALSEVAQALCRRVEPAQVPLAVTLDTIDYFRRAQIVCAATGHPAPGRPAPASAAERGPDGAVAFAEALRAALAAAGFSPDLKPFRTHVTLARKVRQPPRDARMSRVRWTFDEFALIESRAGPQGSSYSIVERWTLCGEGARGRSVARPAEAQKGPENSREHIDFTGPVKGSL